MTMETPNSHGWIYFCSLNSPSFKDHSDGVAGEPAPSMLVQLLVFDGKQSHCFGQQMVENTLQNSASRHFIWSIS